MSRQGAIPVWIDTDPAIGIPGADVDDGLALVQAFHSPELAVRGVSVVFGNAPLDQTHPVAREVVERFGPPGLPVVPGAASADARGEDGEAVQALAAALESEPLVILALGPLTNVASLVLQRPDLTPRIARIVMVAGRRPGQRFLSVPSQRVPFPDLNFDCDPEAVQVLLDAGRPLVFAPWEVSSHVWLTAEDLDRLEAGGEAGAYLATRSRPWLEIWQRDLGAPGFNPFDTLAIAQVSHPGLLRARPARARIEPGPDDTAPAAARAAGRTKPHLLVDLGEESDPGETAGPRGVEDAPPPALYCHEPRPGFKTLLLERLAGPPS